jgi:tetratricopeptide (TPR) repeat protein
MPDDIEAKQGLTLAVAIHQAGRIDEAQRLYREILEADAADPDALHLLGVTYFQQGVFDVAAQLIGESISLNPGNGMAYSNLGNVLQQLGRGRDAIVCYDAALKIDPYHSDAFFNRGIALTGLKLDSEAVDSFDRVLAIDSTHVGAHFNRGNSLYSLGCYDDALVSYDAALELRPDHAEVQNNRGNVLHVLGRNLDAVASYDDAIRNRVGYAEAFFNRGISLQSLERNEDALASYSDAIRITPDYAQALNNQGNTFQSLELYQSALNSYSAAQEIDPTYGDPHWNEAICRLKTGDFERGWEKYEWRWDHAISNPARRRFNQPQWSGQEDLNGKTILLHAEQGLGDTIQFCRYAEMVARGGARVILEVDPSLFDLMTDLPGISEIVLPDQNRRCDYHCPLLSLPLAFDTRLSTIPAPEGYLRSDPVLGSIWRARLGVKTRPRVGLVWAGNRLNQSDPSRSVGLQTVIPLIRDRVEWFSLQKEFHSGDTELMAVHGIRNSSGELNTFSETAALIDQMDIVVTVDTAVAHLAGALGKPTWILLAHNADFRWLLGRRDSPWYPTVRLFRQTSAGDWSSPLEKLGQQLDLVCRGKAKNSDVR